MEYSPKQPHEELESEDYQRFTYACAHERRSPTTRRLIDAASYGWVYQFIQEQDENTDVTSPPGDSWLEVHDANPRKLAEFFGRVAIRLRRTGAFEYASLLESYYNAIADERGLP